MIVFKKGNLFDSECQTLVNTVNCNGVMGKGIALQFKQRYPEMFNEYKRLCSGKNYKGIGKLKQGGDIWLYPYVDLYKERNILCFATKENWWNKSKIEWIERGLKTLTNKFEFEDDYDTPKGYSFCFYENLNIKSIAWPKLGCTNGGLKWEDVKPLMIKYLEPLKIVNEIYE